MRTRRAQVLDAAMALFVEQGTYGSTHRKVDARAGVPMGTTANYFPTRKALLRSIVRAILIDDEVAATSSKDLPADSVEELLLSWFRLRAGHLLGPGRLRALSWYRFTVDGSADPEVRAELAEVGRRIFEDCREIAEQCGAPDPARLAETLRAYVGTLIMSKFTDLRGGFDLDQMLAPIVRGVAHSIRTATDYQPAVRRRASPGHSAPVPEGVARRTRRDEVLDAAIRVLVDRGGRGLTYRAVDAAAGVPAGTASNHFRSRHDLLVGTTECLAERMVKIRAGRPVPSVANEDELVMRLGNFSRGALDKWRTESIAISVLIFEWTTNGEVAARLGDTVEWFRDLCRDWLKSVGAEDPETGAALLIALNHALTLHHHAEPDHTFEPERAYGPLVWGLLHPADDG